MNVRVVQFYCGHDQTYMKLVNEVKEINGAYCKQQNYQYNFDYVQKKTIDDFINTNYFRWNVCAYRFPFLYNYLMKDDSDFVVYMDADAVVSKPTVRFEDLIDQKHDLFLCRSDSKHDQKQTIYELAEKINVAYKYDWLNNMYFQQFMDNVSFYTSLQRLYLGYLFLNQGVLVVRNTPLMKQFFRDAMTLVPFFNDLKYNTMITDGRVLRFLTYRNKYKDCWKIMYDQAQGSHASINEAKYDEEKTFILHDYQLINFNQRLNNIKQLKTNKWWKDYDWSM